MVTQKEQIEELKNRVENLEAELMNRVESLEAEVETLKMNDTWRQLHIDNLYRLVDGNDQYSRKNNLIFDGLFIPRGADDAKIRQIVLTELRRVQVEIEDHQVDRAHRIERPYRDENGKLHIPVIVRFTGWHARNLVYEARKSMNAFVRADLTSRRKSLLSNIKNEIDDADSRASKLLAYAFADRNCYITIKSKNGRYFKVSGFNNELNSLLNFIEDTQEPSNEPLEIINDQMCDFEDKPSSGNTANDDNRIVNLNEIENVEEWLSNPNHIYCGRQHGNLEESRWHNPYKLSEHSIQASLRMFEEHVTSSDDLANDLGSLKGKILACWCPDPSKCHCSVLLKLID